MGLINHQRHLNGRTPLPFIVPTLYELAGSSSSPFVDITMGRSDCGEPNIFGFGTCCDEAWFQATPGVDAMTGVGTPVFQRLLELLA